MTNLFKIDDLVKIAKRENNTKRSYLYVNPVQGKHVPVSPSLPLLLFSALAAKIESRYPEERLLVIGFAETATAIGSTIAYKAKNAVYYMNTTRESVAGAAYLFFTESHSHATEQRLVANGMGDILSNVDRVIFAEDEVTTGSTIEKLIRILQGKYADKALKFGIISILNSMPDARLRELEGEGIPCDCLYRLPVRYRVDEVERQRGQRFAIRHCANSGAVASYPETYLDMVRPGILLYGCGDLAAGLGLRPVMTLKTTVSTIKVYEPGTSVSYGRRFVTDRTTRMGVVPYGYADGFFRCLSDRWQMMTAEGPALQRGRICMDMCMVDLTDLPEVQVGDELEIFGHTHPVEELAKLAGTISYELTCAVSKRVPRVYLQNGQEVEKELLLRF